MAEPHRESATHRSPGGSAMQRGSRRTASPGGTPYPKTPRFSVGTRGDTRMSLGETSCVYRLIQDVSPRLGFAVGCVPRHECRGFLMRRLSEAIVVLSSVSSVRGFRFISPLRGYYAVSITRFTGRRRGCGGGTSAPHGELSDTTGNRRRL